MCGREVAVASGTTKVGAAKCSTGCCERERERASKEMVFLCQMVGGIETKNVCSNRRCNTKRQQRLQSLLADRLSVWTAGLISASLLAHNRRTTPTQLKEEELVSGGGEALPSESLFSPHRSQYVEHLRKYSHVACSMASA